MIAADSWLCRHGVPMVLAVKSGYICGYSVLGMARFVETGACIALQHTRSDDAKGTLTNQRIHSLQHRHSYRNYAKRAVEDAATREPLRCACA